MDPLVDTLIYLIIIGGAALVIGGLICGIRRMTRRIRCINDAERRIHSNRSAYRLGFRRAQK